MYNFFSSRVECVLSLLSKRTKFVLLTLNSLGACFLFRYTKDTSSTISIKSRASCLSQPLSVISKHKKKFR